MRTLDDAQPVFEYVRSFTPDLTAFLTNFGQVAANYDANGHYARVFPTFFPATFSGGTLTASNPDQELQNVDTGNFSRCPGGGVQPPPDGSAPLAAAGACDPSTTPPGP